MGIKYGKLPLSGMSIMHDTNMGDWSQYQKLMLEQDGTVKWVDVYQCPWCGYNTYEKIFNYCPICGRKLKA